MKALITGANGFVGRRLCKALEAQGAEVFTHDLDVGDLTQPGALDAYPACDTVYHLAAMTFVPQSWEQTHRFFQVNLMGTITALEYCRAHHTRLVMMSTYVYGEPKYLPVDEKHPVHPVSPYHESKLLCEDMCRFYHNNFGTDIVIFRPFNIYGLGQSSAFLLPKVMEQVLDPARERVEVFDLTPKRDYIYVDDIVRALMLAQGCPDGLHTLNLGSGVSICVGQAIETILRVAGISKPVVETQQKRTGEISDCRADVSAARELIGFSTKYSFEAGICAWLNEMKARRH